MADKWEDYAKRVKAGETPQKILDEMGIKRYCCRRMYISHVDIIDEFLKFSVVAARKRVQGT